MKTSHFLFFLLIFPTSASAITEAEAVRAIVGEAAGEPYLGKVALAEALRNRGTLRGVYGAKRAEFIKKQPKKVHSDALKAWRESARTSYTKGARHWESTDFKVPYWAKKMEPSFRVGKHIFYVENNKGNR